MTWRMIRSWISHGLVTLAWSLPGFVAGVVVGGLKGAALGAAMWATSCAIGFYWDREYRQHKKDGTHGVLAWVDRFGDVGSPVLVALGLTMWAIALWM